MKNLFGQYVKDSMKRKGLTRGQLAAVMGYKNIDKGCRRLLEVETGEFPDEIFLEKLIDALELDPEKAWGYLLAMENEAEIEFAKWQKNPVPMRIIVENVSGTWMGAMIAAVHDRIKIPVHVVSEEEATDYACHVARDKGLALRLILNRRWSLLINKDGKVISRSETTKKMPELFG